MSPTCCGAGRPGDLHPDQVTKGPAAFPSIPNDRPIHTFPVSGDRLARGRQRSCRAMASLSATFWTAATLMR